MITVEYSCHFLKKCDVHVITKEDTRIMAPMICDVRITVYHYGRFSGRICSSINWKIYIGVIF